ncbi:me53 [Cyclophragma undans nucleopolyhedrovirus]|uniref:Me53 n=1 Tax=Cyclophragma undans nucleopolyhedrovirus TaxID=1906244 RepID=A0A288QPQ7_9ABAC|nr:me53 [Cyclophragma undans nucleopolyhedrovirus]AOT85487.1 me53 [Cyclophragma undans nucleopolyhedrovirus]
MNKFIKFTTKNHESSPTSVKQRVSPPAATAAAAALSSPVKVKQQPVKSQPHTIGVRIVNGGGVITVNEYLNRHGVIKHNPAAIVWTDPSFGCKFEKQKCTPVTGERDLRQYFLSEVERTIMLATLKFSTNYIQGYIDSRDMRLMGKSAAAAAANGDLVKYKAKTTENVVESICTICKYKFKDDVKPWFLYVIVNKDKPLNDPHRFDICCFECKNVTTNMLYCHEIYPRVHILDLHRLFRERFFFRYIFPFEVDCIKTYTKKYQITDHHGKLFELMQNLVLEHRRANEHIVEINLSTTAGLALKEKYSYIRLQRYRSMTDKPATADDVNCFVVEGDSEMLKALKTKMFQEIKGTVFASVLVREYSNMPDCVITFPLNNSAFCKVCKKTKMHYKNPILYCTRCGFTDRHHFPNNKFMFLNYFSKAVKKYYMHNEMILYYDISLYKRLNAV